MPTPSARKRDFSSSRKIVIVTCLVLLGLIFWNTYSSIKLHQSYQHALMDSVTNSVLSDYQEHLTQLRAAIDQFQYRHQHDINQLAGLGAAANKDAYMALLNQLKAEIPDVRLFSVVDENGQGIFKHITGDFLPDCKEEIHDTISTGTQENIFLHHSKTSVHFDLLEPLVIMPDRQWFFFVAFNTTVFEELLNKYRLPYQQLFLLRQDNIGKIELSTEPESANNVMSMSEDEIQRFNFLKDIPKTRWQLAIRLSPEYTTKVIRNGAIKAIVLWLFASGLIFVFYKALRKRISKQRAIEKELAFESSHDSLTGTINRATFEKALESAISNKHQSQGKVGTIFLIDIDNFQLINNTYGYGEGDNCLNLLSRWLVNFLPAQAIISRLGNDEFSVLLDELSHDQAVGYANNIREHISALKFTQLTEEISLTASIGVYNLYNNHQDVGTVLNSLSQAVKLAKHKGSDCVQLYQSDDDELIQHAQEMAVIKDVRHALSSDRFVLYRQRIVDLQQEETAKYEILIRLKDESGMVITPGVFIPAAEKYGVIRQVDRWVIQATFKAINAYEADLNTKYSINLSGLTLADNEMYDYVSQLLQQYSIEPSRIGFEITETYAITHLESAIEFITKMTDLGCEFSLDDFGSGLSSFSYLQKLPVHHVKIDGSFVHDICTNRLNQVFVESMHKVVSEMGKNTIAEFVEDEKALTLLTEIGIDMAQGYYCHKPEPWQP